MMGLNDIRLSSTLTAALYKNVLIDTDTNEAAEKHMPPATPVATTEATGTLKSLGNNQKNILVAVNYTGITHLPDEELNFLTNILAACKLDMGDIAIINIANTPGHSYKKYTGHFKSRIVLLFGIDPVSFGLPVDFPAFQVQPVAGCTFLYAPVLEECRQDNLLKSKLWVCLRRIFGI